MAYKKKLFSFFILRNNDGLKDKLLGSSFIFDIYFIFYYIKIIFLIIMEKILKLNFFFFVF